MTSLVVVLPLRSGARDEAVRLAAGGPPLDPEVARLDSYEACVTDAELVLSFAGVEDALVAYAHEVRGWAAAPPWGQLAAGPPRVAEPVYAWVRPIDSDGLSFASTPGPGDSDGGDVFAPVV